jgi:hypothetical protein
MSVQAESPKPVQVRFETVDEVVLEGLFYPNENHNKAPCALILHDIGSHCRHPGWVQLARKLQENGYAVLLFDFRGHGKSTVVNPAFWRVPVNGRLKNASPKKTEVSVKDFSPGYMPMLVNDIAAARHFLDRKNDARDCNVSNLVVIGSQESATLGVLWLATEWHKKTPKDGERFVPAPRGEDVAAAVWLSISPTLGGGRVSQTRLDSWLRPLREKTPMAFLYGEEDKTATTVSNYLCNQVLRADVPPRLKNTATKGFKTKAAGVELLNRGLGTEDKIVNYLQNVLETRDEQEWRERDWKKAKVDFVNLKPFGFGSP